MMSSFIIDQLSDEVLLGMGELNGDLCMLAEKVGPPLYDAHKLSPNHFPRRRSRRVHENHLFIRCIF
jgi:hypothetical protein